VAEYKQYSYCMCMDRHCVFLNGRRRMIYKEHWTELRDGHPGELNKPHEWCEEKEDTWERTAVWVIKALYVTKRI